MTYELPRLEDGSVDWGKCVSNVIFHYGNGDVSVNNLKAIDANARAEEREQCLKMEVLQDKTSDAYGQGYRDGVSAKSQAIRNLGDE